MKFVTLPCILLALLSLKPLSAETVSAFTQAKDVVFADHHGVGLMMDIFTPTSKSNNRGLVVVASGGWSSDRGKIRDLNASGVFQVFCQRGYHVFAIRPGSVSRFPAADMTRHVEEGIKWVKGKAAHYEIDPERLGIFGASAGGHLASLVTLTSPRKEAKTDATVAAAVVFFPPTDMLDFGGKALSPFGEDRLSLLIRGLGFRDRYESLSDDDITDGLTAISPARLVSQVAPPFLLIHGDADKTVPLQQSETFLKALQAKDVAAKLIVKPGGGHPWLTIREEVVISADWLDQKLGLTLKAAP